MPRVFALADTHLGFGVGKTMDRFGPLWVDHPHKIRDRARALIAPGDFFLLPGDLSWATKRPDAQPDLDFLATLPGIKIAIKGNHDFWWESDKPLVAHGLQSPPVIVADGKVGFAGTRGWYLPIEGTETYDSDRKNFARERKRLAKSLAAVEGCETKIVLLHYPPHPFLDLLAAANVALCVYGHIHLGSFPEDEALAVFEQTLQGVRCYCVACDRIAFTPQEVFSF